MVASCQPRILFHPNSLFGTNWASCLPQQRARFLAASSPHSGDWLLALPIKACGFWLSDEAVRVAVALRLGCSICVPHYCWCGSLVDAQGLHGLVCKQAPSRIIRHHALNDVVACAIQSAGTPVTKEPVGLTRLERQKARWPNIDTMARRQTFHLGRHRSEHTGSFLFVVFCSVCRHRSRPHCQ